MQNNLGRNLRLNDNSTISLSLIERQKLLEDQISIDHSGLNTICDFSTDEFKYPSPRVKKDDRFVVKHIPLKKLERTIKFEAYNHNFRNTMRQTLFQNQNMAKHLF